MEDIIMKEMTLATAYRMLKSPNKRTKSRAMRVIKKINLTNKAKNS